MRHDDTIRTAVSLAAKDSPDAQAAAFRQLTDLSLQGRDCDDPHLRWQAIRAFARLQRSAPVELRNAMIDKAARQGAGALHARLYRANISHHYDRLLQVAKLDEPAWWRLARRAPPHLHALMLARRDLPGPVRELLESPAASSSVGRLFVADDRLATGSGRIADISRFVAPEASDANSAAATPSLATGQNQIRELLRRIAKFRQRPPEATEATEAASAMPAAAPRPAGEVEQRWTWRCDEGGVFTDSPDMPSRLVGQWLTAFETPDAPGQLVRAFERRVPFRDLACTASRGLGVAGRWRLAGLPQFDRRGGRFTGYWGSAIALDAAAQPAEPKPAGLLGTGASSEALSMMAHEVRTPLNAIIGFAQLIEGEILGEAGEAYRVQAGNILRHAEKLLGAFDDLSDAARIEQGRYRVAHENFDPGASVRDVVQRYESLAADRDVAIAPLIAADLPTMIGDASVLDRALSRLMTATLAAAVKGEAIYVIVQRAEGGMLRIAVSRPRAMTGKSAEALFDTVGLEAAGDGAPILGIGFALKLAGSLATAAGGRIDLGTHLIELYLPLAESERRDSEAS